jgi:Zn-dependent peptidase ImmA (M78 family)
MSGGIVVNIQKSAAAAQQLLDEHGIQEPYVDIVKIAEKAGIEIRPVYFEPPHDTISGFLTMDDDRPVIYVNAAEDVRRQTFTIAHELGHYFLQHPPNKWGIHLRDTQYFDEKEDHEKEADYFAAYLLMPEKLLQKQMKKYGLTDRDYNILAEMFGVSADAMRRRLTYLENHNGAA